VNLCVNACHCVCDLQSYCICTCVCVFIYVSVWEFAWVCLSVICHNQTDADRFVEKERGKFRLKCVDKINWIHVGINFIYIYMRTLLVRLCTRPLASLSTYFSISINSPPFSRILLNLRLNACLEWRGDGPGKSMAWPVTRSETLWGGGLEGHDLRWQLLLNLLIRLLLRGRGILPVKQTTSQVLWPRINW